MKRNCDLLQVPPGKYPAGQGGEISVRAVMVAFQAGRVEKRT